MPNGETFSESKIHQIEQKIFGCLKQWKLVQAAKILKKNNYASLEIFQTELDKCLDELYSRSPSVILSAYHISELIKNYGRYTVGNLLEKSFQKKDYANFLKQIYRLNFHIGYEDKIEICLKWYEDKKRNDALAWRSKFNKLFDEKYATSDKDKSEKLSDNSNLISNSFVNHFDFEYQKIDGLISEVENNRVIEKINLTLRSISVSRLEKSSDNFKNNSINDPYIVSQIARAKLERANQQHEMTLQILAKTLNSMKYEALETKLIDIFSIIKDKPAIFEVKSIHSDNERDQVRHAISQLYEYRYLYDLKLASLWVVFSKSHL